MDTRPPARNAPGSGAGVGNARARRPRPLTAEERLLVELREWLYEGSWEMLLSDLTSRLAGRPHLFELFADLPDEATRRQRIFDDINRARDLMELEIACGADLADWLDNPPPPDLRLVQAE
jgi:hypothetical protein